MQWLFARARTGAGADAKQRSSGGHGSRRQAVRDGSPHGRVRVNVCLLTIYNCQFLKFIQISLVLPACMPCI